MTDRILASIARHPTHTDLQISKNLRGVNTAQVAAVRASKKPAPPKVLPPAPAAPKKEETVVPGGVRLSNLRVLNRRPAESAAKFIKRLPKGRGFCPKDLSQEWGMSEETIKRHARDMNCLKFVEVSEDEWKPLIVSPETAANYNA